MDRQCDNNDGDRLLLGPDAFGEGHALLLGDIVCGCSLRSRGHSLMSIRSVPSPPPPPSCSSTWKLPCASL